MLHNEFTPHAFITLCNNGCIEIMLNRSNDGVYYRFNYGQNLESEYIYDAEIEHQFYNVDSEDGKGGDNNDAGFWHHNTGNNPPIFYSLSEAMRIN